MLEPQLAALAAAQRGAFTRKQARAAGYLPARIDGLVRTGRWRVLRKGVYVDRDAYATAAADPTRLHLLLVSAAVLRLGEDVFASHESGALVHGLRVLTIPEDVQLSRHAAELRSSDHYDKLYVHRAALPAGHLVPDLGAVAAARAVADVARERGLLAGVVTADAALHLRRCSKAELLSVARDLQGWPGAEAVRRAAELADGRGESVGESVSRLRLMDTDLPQPVPQFKVYANGRLLGISDFGWEEYGLLGEVDGRSKYRENPFDSVWSERIRQQSFQDSGNHIVRWTHDEALYEFGDVVAPRIRRELDRAIAMRSA